MTSALIVITALSIVGFLYYRYSKQAQFSNKSSYSFEDLDKLLKSKTIELLKEADTLAASDEEYIAAKRAQKRYERALRECVDGVASARSIVIAIYRSMLQEELPTFEDVCKVLPFDSPMDLGPMVKFELLLLFMKKTHGNKGLKAILQEYPETFDIRFVRNEDLTGRVEVCERREFDAEMLNKIYMEKVGTEPVPYSRAIEILSIIEYQRLKGFGAIDTLMAQAIDGIEIGTSGTLRADIDNDYTRPYKMTNSVWVQAGTPWFHLSFIDLKSVGEMRRIVNQVVSHGNVASLSEAEPTIVNEMWDGSRAVGIRPSVGECWAMFVRKFTIDRLDLRFLLDKGELIKNWQLVYVHLQGLMRSLANIAFTGGQNTGKTTIMKALMVELPDTNIRVLEKSFETHLRELYSGYNTFTVKSNDFRSSSELQDLLKKSDSDVSIMGEVADDETASRMIQFGKVGSARTFWSSHHKTDFSLVTGLADSLVATGDFKDYESAISAVLEVVKINCHLIRINGQRVIGHISEIIEIPRMAPYDNVKDSESIIEAIDQMTRLNREYYTRVTDRPRFKSRKIIEFDPIAFGYKTVEWYTPETDKMILESIKKDEHKKAWLEHYAENWGGRAV